MHQFSIIPHFVYCVEILKYSILITNKVITKRRNFYIDNTRTRH